MANELLRSSPAASPPPWQDLKKITAPSSLRSFFKNLANNLLAGLQLALFLPAGLTRLRPSLVHLYVLLLTVPLLSFAAQFLIVALEGEQGGDPALFHTASAALALFAALVLSAWIAAQITSQAPLALRAATAIAALGAFLIPLATLPVFPPRFAADTNLVAVPWREWLSWLIPLWLAGAGTVAMMRLLRPAARLRLAAALSVFVVLLSAGVMFAPLLILWTPKNNPAQLARLAERARTAGESVLYGQAAALEQALLKIGPGQPGVPEFFFVGFAGHGPQDVFRNEMLSVNTMMQQRFAKPEHSFMLINDVSEPQVAPFATVTALQAVLKRVAQQMNGDEDVLLLFLSSHGTEERGVHVEMPPYQFQQLTPPRLRNALDAAGIRHRVVVVSACYSGVFVEPLKSPETMVITAAHAKRKSFGCRDGEQWTYFGQAFFAEALQQTDSFEAAFADAFKRVAIREKKEGFEPSEPQISVGEAIRPRLQAVQAALAQRNHTPSPAAQASNAQ